MFICMTKENLYQIVDIVSYIIVLESIYSVINPFLVTCNIAVLQENNTVCTQG